MTMLSDSLKLVLWPDPVLKRRADAVTTFDEALRDLSMQMLELMRASKGVGLAAPQVGKSIRLFVMNHTARPEDDLVAVNPVLTVLEGEDEAEEGCLSLPDIHIPVLRGVRVRLEAQGLDGTPFVIERDDFATRVWQHEVDHLDGILLTDRMRFSDKMRHRSKLRDLEARYGSARSRSTKPGTLRTKQAP